MENGQRQSPEDPQAFTWGKPRTVPAASVGAPSAAVTLFDAVLAKHGRLACRIDLPGGTDVTVTAYRGDVEIVRTFRVPVQGLVIPLGTGRVRITALNVTGFQQDVVLNAGVAYGRPVAEWTVEPLVALPGLGVSQQTPPAWSRRLHVAVIDGSLTSPVLVAGASMTLPAVSIGLTAGALPTDLAVAWELFT